jgi:hypothetical protein
MAANKSLIDKVNELQTDVAVIRADVKSGNKETARRLGKIDDAMQNFAFVKQSDFEEFKRFVYENYTTKEEFKPVKTLFWSIISALIGGLITIGFLAFQQKAGL